MRRRLVALTVVPLLLFGAAACGEGDSEESAEPTPSVDMGEPIEGVSVSGEVGEEPTVEIDTPLKIEETQSQVVTAGEGAEVAEGNMALLHLYVANGSTGEKAATTYEQGTPVPVEMVDGQIFASVIDALVDKPSGSRVVIAATPEDAYGSQGMPQMKLEPKDNVVFVVDIISAEPTDVLDGPQGDDVTPEDKLPTVVEKDGDVSDITWDEAPNKPAKKLQVIPLVEGDGPPVRDDSLVTFDYYGQVYGEDKPFDQSFSKEPVTFPLGIGRLIKGWDEGLVGVNEGSRVMIITPPEYGYGEQGSPPNIPGNATLVFVVDILGVG